MSVKDAVAGIGIFGFALCACAGAPGKSTPAGFTDDFEAAKAEAAKSGRNMLAVFSGSDWCHWCKVLEKDYLSKPEFVNEAKKDFVLVFIDSPRDKSVLSETAKKNNVTLTRSYGIKGFPTVKILDAKGGPISDCRPKNGARPKDYALQLRREVKVGPLLKKHLRSFETDMQTMMDDFISAVMKQAQEAEKGKKGEVAEKAQFELVQKKTSELIGKFRDLARRVEAVEVPDEIRDDKTELVRTIRDRIANMERTLKMTWNDVRKMKGKPRKSGEAK